MGRTREYLKRLDALEEAKEQFAAREAEYAELRVHAKATDDQKASARRELTEMLDAVERRIKDSEPYFDALVSDSKAAYANVQAWQKRFLADNRGVVASI